MLGEHVLAVPALELQLEQRLVHLRVDVSLTLSIQFYNFASTNDKKHHKKSTLKEGGRVELLNATQKSVRAALFA